MNSRLLKPAPFEQVELPSLSICLTEDDLRGEVDRHITNELLSRRSYKQVSEIEAGDIVTGILNGRQLLVTVGSGLFDTGLEKDLSGRHAGETARTDTLSFDIEKAERLIIPALTDLWVKSLNLDNLATVDEYRTYLTDYYRDFYLENYLLYFAMEFFINWMQASEWYWDEEELDTLLEEYRAMEKRYLDAHDTYIEGTEEELTEAARESMMETVGQYLYLQYTDPASAPETLSFDTQDTMETIRSLALRPMIDFLRDKVTFTDTEEDV